VPKKAKKLSYNYNDCVWKNSDGEVVSHPRYGEQPRSLDSKIFFNAYLVAVSKQETLNDFLRHYNKFSADKVQAAARKMRKAYEEVTAAAGHKASFELLKKETKRDNTEMGKAVANALEKSGIRNEHHPAHKALAKAHPKG